MPHPIYLINLIMKIENGNWSFFESMFAVLYWWWLSLVQIYFPMFQILFFIKIQMKKENIEIHENIFYYDFFFVKLNLSNWTFVSCFIFLAESYKDLIGKIIWWIWFIDGCWIISKFQFMVFDLTFWIYFSYKYFEILTNWLWNWLHFTTSSILRLDTLKYFKIYKPVKIQIYENQ